MDKNVFLELPAIRVEQPLGEFYVVRFKAQDLLDISFSEPLRYIDEFGNVRGSQRPKKKSRLQQIAKYVDSVEMAFPNTIILAANYTKVGTVSKDQSERWKIIEDKICGMHKLVIPKKIELAAVIDGQHRLNAFEYVTKQERFTDLQLICSVYFDIPNSYQAFLFATINSNQKKVDRSLALEQFGFNVEDEPEKAWTPEKLAVFLSRRLNIDRDDSPFFKHIKVAPQNPEALFADGIDDVDWQVSTATIVDGILGLISSNPKRDRIEMQQHSIFKGRSRELLSDIRDLSPLRSHFLNCQDRDIYNVVLSFFESVKTNLWSSASNNSYIMKTVGIQACFDLLKATLKKTSNLSPLEVDFNQVMIKAKGIDFSDKYFQASGIGRSRIKKVLGIATGIIEYKKLSGTEIDLINNIITNKDHRDFLWSEEAEQIIQSTLDKAEWIFKSKTVRLYLESDYDSSAKFTDYNSFFYKLVELADQAFSDRAPSDKEMKGEIEFDGGAIVEKYLDDYSDQLQELGWW